MEDKIKEIFMRKFDGVYCDSCMCESQGDTEPCDYCHRKAMNWRISEEYAEQIVKEIIEVI